jgi:tetratricopeptide (TPR) repeat protein
LFAPRRQAAKFKAERKQHYNEFQRVQEMRRKLAEEDDDDDGDNGAAEAAAEPGPEPGKEVVAPARSDWRAALPASGQAGRLQPLPGQPRARPAVALEDVHGDGSLLKAVLRPADTEEWERPWELAAVRLRCAAWPGGGELALVVDEPGPEAAAAPALWRDLDAAARTMRRGERALLMQSGGEATELRGQPGRLEVELLGFENMGSIALNNPAQSLADFAAVKVRGAARVAGADYVRAARRYRRCVDLLEYDKKHDFGAWTEAQKDERDREVVAAYSNLALCLLKLGDAAAAAEACDAVLKMAPRHVKALYRRGTARAAAGGAALDGAVEDFKLLLEVEPANSAAKRAAAQARRGLKEWRASAEGRAAATAERAAGLQARPTSAQSAAMACAFPAHISMPTDPRE